jgi:hypothetical protein
MNPTTNSETTFRVVARDAYGATFGPERPTLDAALADAETFAESSLLSCETLAVEATSTTTTTREVVRLRNAQPV